MTRKMVQIRIDPEFWQQAKAAAALAGKTLQEWIEGAIAAKLRR